MENLNAITQLFARIWDVMTIEHPLLGIPFSVIYLGVFAVGFGITILKPMLGIGRGIAGDINKASRKIRSKRSNNNERSN